MALPVKIESCLEVLEHLDCGFVLRTPTLRVGSRFGNGDCGVLI
jgi:hypothetical protein